MCPTGRQTNKPWESSRPGAEVRIVGIGWGCLRTWQSSLSTATPTLPTVDPIISGLSTAGGPWALSVEAVSSSKFSTENIFFTFCPQFCPRGGSRTWSCSRPAGHPEQKCNQQLLKGLPRYYVGSALPYWFWYFWKWLLQGGISHNHGIQSTWRKANQLLFISLEATLFPKGIIIPWFLLFHATRPRVADG